jgi:hypothetical protein
MEGERRVFFAAAAAAGGERLHSDGGRAAGSERAVRTGTSGVDDEEECVQWSSYA